MKKVLATLIIVSLTFSIFAPQAEAETTPRAWKDDTSFGLENNYLLLYGDYIHYGGNNPVFWEYLIFKDTGTKWTSPWGDIIAVDPSPREGDPGFWQVEAHTGSGEASITMTYRTTNANGSLLWKAEFWIEDKPYIRMTVHATNEGPDMNSRDVRMGFYTFIAGDTSNDYFYVPGVGQGQYTGTQKNLIYDPAEPWMAVWDQAKQEGCGVVWGNGFSFPPCQAIIHDWYGLTAVAQGGWSVTNTQILDVGETSQKYKAYLYFFTGTGWQKTKDFYDSLSPILGDINADGIVDILDVVIAALAFASRPGDPNWNPQADINNDLLVDIFDLVIIGINYGYVDP